MLFFIKIRYIRVLFFIRLTVGMAFFLLLCSSLISWVVYSIALLLASLAGYIFVCPSFSSTLGGTGLLPCYFLRSYVLESLFSSSNGGFQKIFCIVADGKGCILYVTLTGGMWKQMDREFFAKHLTFLTAFACESLQRIE
jgi:hypothetical protein